MVGAIWHGSEEALQDLVNAVDANCQCDGTMGFICGPHMMMLDQEVLDHFKHVWDVRSFYKQAEYGTDLES